MCLIAHRPSLLTFSIPLSSLQLSDPQYEVRVNAHAAIEMCARTKEGESAEWG